MIHIADFNFANVMRVRSAPVDGCYCVSRLYPHRQRSYWVSQIRKPSRRLIQDELRRSFQTAQAQ